MPSRIPISLGKKGVHDPNGVLSRPWGLSSVFVGRTPSRWSLFCASENEDLANSSFGASASFYTLECLFVLVRMVPAQVLVLPVVAVHFLVEILTFFRGNRSFFLQGRSNSVLLHIQNDRSSSKGVPCVRNRFLSPLQ